MNLSDFEWSSLCLNDSYKNLIRPQMIETKLQILLW